MDDLSRIALGAAGSIFGAWVAITMAKQFGAKKALIGYGVVGGALAALV